MTILFFLAIMPHEAFSQCASDSISVPDSVSTSGEKHTGKVVSSLVAPAILIGTGIAAMNDGGWYGNLDVYENIQKDYPGFHSNMDDFVMLLPAAAVYGLNLAGIKGKNSFIDRSLLFLVSLSLAGATTSIIKRSTDVLRPDGSDFLSFPSSHASIAFVSATFLHEEYKDQSIWYGIGGYTIATVSAALRMLNNRHWLSDVLVGAGLGILATKAVYLAYPAVKSYVTKKSGRNYNPRLKIGPCCIPGHYGIFMQYRIH